MFYLTYASTTGIYTLSLHDALPISGHADVRPGLQVLADGLRRGGGVRALPDHRRRDARTDAAAGEAMSRRSEDRKSTRLNSSHPSISYAVFCLKKKKSCGSSSPRRR